MAPYDSPTSLPNIPNPILFNNPPSLPLGRYLLVRHSGARARTVSFNSRGNIVTTSPGSERMARESLALLAEHAELASNTDWEQNNTGNHHCLASPRLASSRQHARALPCITIMIPRFMSQPYLVIFPLAQVIIKILLEA